MMIYNRTHMATVGVKGLKVFASNTISMLIVIVTVNVCVFIENKMSKSYVLKQ